MQLSLQGANKDTATVSFEVSESLKQQPGWGEKVKPVGSPSNFAPEAATSSSFSACSTFLSSASIAFHSMSHEIIIAPAQRGGLFCRCESWCGFDDFYEPSSALESIWTLAATLNEGITHKLFKSGFVGNFVGWKNKPTTSSGEGIKCSTSTPLYSL